MNIKKYVYSLLTDCEELVEALGTGKILASYPQEIKTFPVVIFEDVGSSDVAFNDNLPDGASANVRIHIFSKTLKGYAKCEDIADIIHGLFRADYWAMTLNADTADVEDNIRHRIMDFKREFFLA